ncbi:MAG: TetR/AcrR family transcriptional regulator C-terminal domain-containing protein [Actinomycetota bacterium]
MCQDLPISPATTPSASPRRTRRRKTDREQIAAAALAVGFPDLTVEAVAAHLGVTHSTLYHHVENRDALLGLAVDRAVAAHPWPAPTGAWQTDLAAVSQSMWALLVAHPGLARASVGATDPGPSAGGRVEQLVRRLVDVGFTVDDAILAVDTVIDLPVDVAIRAPTHGHDVVADGPAHQWFERKLDLVLAGIEVRLAPRGAR